MTTISRGEIMRAICATALLLSVADAARAQAPVPPPIAEVPPQITQLIGGLERRFVEAVRMDDDEAIVLDGRLDEGVWERALPARDFVQIDPRNGEPATEPTEVRIVFSQTTFYMGVTAYDSEPERWLGYQRRRDEFLGSDDRFMWRIDTFLDERSGYFFEMNPSGLMADAVFNVNGMNRAWDGIWNARVRHHELGWTIEIEIPFRTLNFDPSNDTWGINFQRTVRRKNEDSIWMGWGRNQGLGRMTNAGRVNGIREVTQGHGLDIKPYGLVSSDRSPGRPGGWNRNGNAGIDFFYNPTPGLRANLTINTDFAQTEVDQRQVNLTRFSLFFPERRDFFLDGATYFDFASNGVFGEQVQPFFTRRIGLSASATPQRIDYGAKFNGQVGAQDVGFLHVRSGDDPQAGFIGEEFTAARVRRRLLQQSYIGALYTRRDGRSDGIGASQTAGLDVRFSTATFRGSYNADFTGWFLRESRPGVTSGTGAWGLGLEFPNDRWFGGVSAREVQANFAPSVGFVARRNYRRFSEFFGFAPRPRNHPVIRRFRWNSNLTFITDLENTIVERNGHVTLFQIEFQSQDTFSVEFDQNYIRLQEPFQLNPAIILPQGAEYSFTRLAVTGQTANRRMLALNGRYETGTFYSGDRHQAVLGLILRARPGYIFTLNTEFNQVDLPEGSFTSNVYRLITDSQFTPYTAIVNNIQFDTVSRVLGWQSRFRWIVKPGNDLYVVYTHNWLENPVADRFTTLDQRFASKVLYTHRF